MPIYSAIHKAPVSSGDFQALKTAAATIDASNTQLPCGQVDAYFANDSAVSITIVFNATSIATAAAENTAFRTLNLPATTRFPFALRIDPNTTWVRSSGAASNFYVTYNW